MTAWVQLPSPSIILSFRRYRASVILPLALNLAYECHDRVEGDFRLAPPIAPYVPVGYTALHQL